MINQLELDRDWYFQEFGELAARVILYELQYYNLYGELPADGIYIQEIEWVGESAIIVHRDPDELRQ